MDNKELVKFVQGLTFEMLKDIDAYCKQNDIMYFLSGGSCLGAIRHKGFIPWDDDIDLMLPREDYEKFLKGFSNYKTDLYKVGSLYTDDEWKRPAARIWNTKTKLRQKTYDEREMGIFVDVFPIDGLPTNALVRWIHYRKIQLLNILRVSCLRKGYFENEKYVFIKRIIDLFLRGKNARGFAVKMDNAAKRQSFNSSQYVGAILAQHYWDKETIKKEFMDRAVNTPFVDGEYPIPIGYDTYLHNLYGDYMMIPPGAEEKGYSHIQGWDIILEEEK